MFFGVSASFQGVSASLLYGGPRLADFAPPAPRAEPIIDVEARSIDAEDRNSSTYADSQRLAAPIETLTYMPPSRRGQAPRMIQPATVPGRLLDVYA